MLTLINVADTALTYPSPVTPSNRQFNSEKSATVALAGIVAWLVSLNPSIVTLSALTVIAPAKIASSALSVAVPNLPALGPCNVTLLSIVKASSYVPAAITIVSKALAAAIAAAIVLK